MTEDSSAEKIVRRLRDEAELMVFMSRLADWIIADSAPTDEVSQSLSEMRAKSLLMSAGVLDETTLVEFKRKIKNQNSTRLALFDLLNQSGLNDVGDVAALASIPSEDSATEFQWLALTLAAFAWKSGYMLDHLDPSSPPDPNSPAGQVLKRSGYFIRLQAQRTPTERDRLGGKLSQPPSEALALDDLTPLSDSLAPLPPHYRPPIPERYPEVARDTVSVDPDEPQIDAPLTIGQPLVITEEEVAVSGDAATEPERMPAITINSDQLAVETRTPPSPMPSTAVVMPNSTVQPRPGFTVALRQMLGQEELTTTKLRILVQEYPDGPGFYGLQIRVRCKGIKSYVAGTTDRDGKFVCELPVRLESGLTYDVELTWPRDQGGEVERKSITLNADRSEFTLPFHRELRGPAEE